MTTKRRPIPLSAAPLSAVKFILSVTLIAAISACGTSAEDTLPEKVPDKPVVEEPAPKESVSIIFDTDLGYDCDDAGALGVLHALADLGEANLLATVTTVGDPYSAGALDVINTYYGRPDLPVGAYMGEKWSDAEPYWLDPATSFLEPLVENYPSSIDTRAQAQEAVTLYRKTLAAEPDASVTVVAVGFLQNLADLLASQADEHSDLSGEALVAQKVKRLVVMGGKYPANGKTRDFNLSGGPEKDLQPATNVIETWPTPIIFSGGGTSNDVLTGESLRETLPENPVARAYELYPAVNSSGNRASWDLVAVLYAVRSESDFWSLREDTHVVINEDGSHEWRPGAVSPARLSLVREVPAEEVEEVLNGLLAQSPVQAETTPEPSP